MVNKAAMLKQLGRYDEALQFCDRAIAATPREAPAAEAWLWKYEVLKDLGRYREADECLERGRRLAGVLLNIKPEDIKPEDFER